MTFLQALYGSQYQELTQNGKDGSKGRFNGNLFLSAFVIISMFLVIALIGTISNGIMDKMNSIFHHLFGYSSGKTIGKLLAIPLMFIIYMIISKTVGSESSYNKIVESFNQLDEAERKKANSKLLVPFFVVLGSLFVLMMFSLIGN